MGRRLTWQPNHVILRKSSSEERLRNGGTSVCDTRAEAGLQREGRAENIWDDTISPELLPNMTQTWNKLFPSRSAGKTSLEKCVQLMDSKQPLCARLSPGCPEISMAAQPRPVPMQRLPCGGAQAPWTCDNCSGASGSGAGEGAVLLAGEQEAERRSEPRRPPRGKSTSDRHSGLGA